MNPQNFIAFAELVFSEHHEQAACRSVISRAYYGAFHLAVSLLADIGVSTEFNHGHLQHDYLNASNAIAYEIGTLLQQLHGLRVEADYRLKATRPEDPEYADKSVDGANDVLERIQQLRAEFQDPAVRQAFIDAITAYRTKVKRRV